jgi:ubiquinone/menaquinone biosynthesis C-methylase UbiE
MVETTEVIVTDELNGATAVVWRRLPYLLSPQMDIYERIGFIPMVEPTILEVGFGTGFGILQYFEDTQWIDAIEIDRAAVRFAKKCFPLPRVRWLEGDILHPPRELGHYDLLVMIEVLEHISDTDLALKNISGLAKRALITVPNSLRYRAKHEVLNEHEWTPQSFYDLLMEHFSWVALLNYEFEDVINFPGSKQYQGFESRETPIIALCSSAS